jgi:hypothetical protein
MGCGWGAVDAVSKACQIMHCYDLQQRIPAVKVGFSLLFPRDPIMFVHLLFVSFFLFFFFLLVFCVHARGGADEDCAASGQLGARRLLLSVCSEKQDCDAGHSPAAGLSAGRQSGLREGLLQRKLSPRAAGPLLPERRQHLGSAPALAASVPSHASCCRMKNVKVSFPLVPLHGSCLATCGRSGK